METTSKTSSQTRTQQGTIERKPKAAGEDVELQKAWTDASSAIETLYTQASTKLQQTVQERPYVALAAAAGIGFVLGGGLGSATGRLLLRSTAQMVLPGVLATLRGDED